MSNWLGYVSAGALAAVLIGTAGFAVPGLGVFSPEAYSKSLVRYAAPAERSYAGVPSLQGAGDTTGARAFVLIVEVRHATPASSAVSSDGAVWMETEVTITRLRDV